MQRLRTYSAILSESNETAFYLSFGIIRVEEEIFLFVNNVSRNYSLEHSCRQFPAVKNIIIVRAAIARYNVRYRDIEIVDTRCRAGTIIAGPVNRIIY